MIKLPVWGFNIRNDNPSTSFTTIPLASATKGSVVGMVVYLHEIASPVNSSVLYTDQFSVSAFKLAMVSSLKPEVKSQIFCE